MPFVSAFTGTRKFVKHCNQAAKKKTKKKKTSRTVSLLLCSFALGAGAASDQKLAQAAGVAVPLFREAPKDPIRDSQLVTRKLDSVLGFGWICAHALLTRRHDCCRTGHEGDKGGDCPTHAVSPAVVIRHAG